MVGGAAQPGWIAYVGPFVFPWGQPGSRRVYGIGRSLTAAGHRVVVASGDHTPCSFTRLAGADGPRGIDYIGLGELPDPDASVSDKALQVMWRWGRYTVNWLDGQAIKPSHVIVYGGSAPYAARLRRWCNRYQVPLIADVVEWYDPRQMPGGRFAPPYWQAQIALRWQYPRFDGVIAISSYLQQYYAGRHVQVLRVPPTLDVEGQQVGSPASRPGRGPVLLYSGTPGRKDLLASIITASARVWQRCGMGVLRVAGLESAEVERLYGNKLPENVHVLGRLPQRDVAEAVRQADFTILLRQEARFTQAGFPTKVVESMAVGTPVVANLTSDLGEHLHDGVEGFVAADHSVPALEDALFRAYRLSGRDHVAMRHAARKQALASFDYRSYVEPLGAFLGEVAACRSS